MGSFCHALLLREGHEVVGATRDPDAARRRFPDRQFIGMEATERESVSRVLKSSGCGRSSRVVYLVHGMKDSANFGETELREARIFRDEAAAAGIERIVYLGGVRPDGEVSKHLQSRLATGECLRRGACPVAELQASMIIGAQSDSFRIVRDLAARLPLMLFPRWTKSRTEPIAIQDVGAAVVHALQMPLGRSAVLPLPGPEIMTAQEIILRTARLLGQRRVTIDVPLLTPTLSAYWLRLVTRTNPLLAAELVEGFRSDLLAPNAGLWQHMHDYRRQSFDEAATTALREEQAELKPGALQWETFIRRISPVSDIRSVTA